MSSSLAAPKEPAPSSEKLPAYESALEAFHEAFRPELEAAIAHYSLRNARVLDLACGDGFYAALFAQHMHGGELVAADHSPAYLRVARKAVKPAPDGPTARFVKADAYALPFDDGSFDFIWCAQSMISLKEPVRALAEMRRVLKPAGRIVILETDEFRHVLLPLPVTLELAIFRALRAASRERFGSGGKLAQARQIRSAFLEAGLTPTRKITIAADRQYPFDDAMQSFLREHFRFLRSYVRNRLTEKQKAAFDQFTNEEDRASFFHQEESEVTCLATLFQATR